MLSSFAQFTQNCRRTRLSDISARDDFHQPLAHRLVHQVVDGSVPVHPSQFGFQPPQSLRLRLLRISCTRKHCWSLILRSNISPVFCAHYTLRMIPFLRGSGTGTNLLATRQAFPSQALLPFTPTPRHELHITIREPHPELRTCLQRHILSVTGHLRPDIAIFRFVS